MNGRPIQNWGKRELSRQAKRNCKRVEFGSSIRRNKQRKPRSIEKVGQDKPWEGLQITIPSESVTVGDAALECMLGDGNRLKFWSDHWVNGRGMQQIAPAILPFVRPSAMHRLVRDFGMHSRRRLRFVISGEALWCRRLLISSSCGTPCWAWSCSRNRIGSGGDCVLMGGSLLVQRTIASSMVGSFSQARLSFGGSWAPLENKIFVWLALHNRLWTADRLVKRNLQHPPHCVLCCQEEEMSNHLLLECSFSREVWFNLLLGRRLHRFTPQPGDRSITF